MNPADAAAAGQTPRQQREEWARTGQYEPLLEVLRRLDPSLLDFEFLWQLVLEAIEVRALEDPEAFASEVLGRMVAFQTYQMVRSQIAVQGRLRQHDRDSPGAGLPPELEDPLKHLVHLQAHLAQLLEVQASVHRKWKLAKGSRPAGKSPSQLARTIELLSGASEPKGHTGPGHGPTRNGVSAHRTTNRLDGNGHGQRGDNDHG